MFDGRKRPIRRMKSLYRIIQWSPPVMEDRPDRRLDGITERKLSCRPKLEEALRWAENSEKRRLDS
jgi:hypothetical protein